MIHVLHSVGDCQIIVHSTRVSIGRDACQIMIHALLLVGA